MRNGVQLLAQVLEKQRVLFLVSEQDVEKVR